MKTTAKRKLRIFPGLLNHHIEFFHQKGRLQVMSSGQVREFKDAPYGHHQILKENLAKDPEADQLLEEWYPNSEFKRIIQFGCCRFGGLDYEADIDNSRIQQGEYSECSARGFCPGEGVLCKAPMYNGVRISFKEVKILQLLASNDTNEMIAARLELPLGTFHLVKKKLYQKLQIQTKPEAVMIGRDLNLI